MRYRLYSQYAPLNAKQLLLLSRNCHRGYCHAEASCIDRRHPQCLTAGGGRIRSDDYRKNSPYSPSAPPSPASARAAATVLATQRSKESELLPAAEAPAPERQQRGKQLPAPQEQGRGPAEKPREGGSGGVLFRKASLISVAVA